MLVQLLVTVCAGCGGEPVVIVFFRLSLLHPFFYVLAAAQTSGRRRAGGMNFIGICVSGLDIVLIIW